MFRLQCSKQFVIMAIIFCLISVPFSVNYGYPKSIALVMKVGGTAKINRLSSGGWENLRMGARLNSGDRIKTAKDALVAIMFTDDRSLMKIRSLSLVTIKARKEKQTISKRIFASFGELWFKVTKGARNLRLETPSGIAAVKGTEFYALITKNGKMKIIGIEGIVELYNKLGSVLVKAGQTGQLVDGKPIVGKSDPSQIPNWAENAKKEQELQLEFEDSNGNKKTLKIIFQSK